MDDDLDHAAGIGGQLRQLVMFGRTAARDFAAVGQGQYAEAADQLACSRFLDHHMAAGGIKLVAVERLRILVPS